MCIARAAMHEFAVSTADQLLTNMEVYHAAERARDLCAERARAREERSAMAAASAAEVSLLPFLDDPDFDQYGTHFDLKDSPSAESLSDGVGKFSACYFTSGDLDEDRLLRLNPATNDDERRIVSKRHRRSAKPHYRQHRASSYPSSPPHQHSGSQYRRQPFATATKQHQPAAHRQWQQQAGWAYSPKAFAHHHYPATHWPRHYPTGWA